RWPAGWARPPHQGSAPGPALCPWWAGGQVLGGSGGLLHHGICALGGRGGLFAWPADLVAERVREDDELVERGDGVLRLVPVLIDLGVLGVRVDPMSELFDLLGDRGIGHLVGR